MSFSFNSFSWKWLMVVPLLVAYYIQRINAAPEEQSMGLLT
jgi:hypothetical protein